MAASPSVYVGDLDPNVTEANLYDHFKNIGPVVSVRVCMDSQTHKSLGYGYVNFQNIADSDTAVENMNGSKILMRAIRVAKIQRDPTQRKSGVANVVIKHLPLDIEMSGLKEIFAPYGKITSIRVATDETGKSRGYAYVMFDSEQSAVKAVEGVNGNEIDGRAITVERYRPMHRAEMMEKFCNLYVKNLAPTVTEDQLYALFATFGEITSHKIRTDVTGKSMGYGYVAFKEHEAAAEAVNALNEHPHELASTEDDNKLYVRRFESKKERQRKREIAWRERQAQYAKFPNLYIKNLEDHVTQQQLTDTFEAFGPTQSVRIMLDRETKISKGFGFVSFKEHASAQKAIQALAGSTILGSRPLYVSYALKRDARRQQFEEMQKKRAQRAAMGPMGGLAGGYPGGVAQLGGYPGAQGMAGPMGMPPGMAGPMRPPVNPTTNPVLAMQMAMQRQGAMLAGGFPQTMPPQRIVRPPPKPATAVPVPQPSLPHLLASMSSEQQKNVLGERLYAHISRTHAQEASKITGMLLEMDNAEILNLLEVPQQLDEKVREALEVLRQHAPGY